MTFDDGPDPVWTPRLLEALGEADVRATFFVMAPLARRYPRLIRETLGHGHRVEFHCTRHIRHTEMTRPELEEDTRLGLLYLAEAGVEPELWRPPWGIRASWTEEVARDSGLELALWTEDTHDWRGDSAREMLGSIRGTLRPGSVVLMHDALGPGARRESCEQTIELVGSLSGHIRKLGCEPETLTTDLVARAK